MTEATTTEFGPKKTVLILAIVAACFALLWPKIFYPMLTTSVNPPQTADSSGCCDVIFESDVTAVDIMQELCHNIIKHHQVDPRVRDILEVNEFNKLSPASASLCREEVLARCGIDLSSFLAEKERSKKSYKQVLEEIRGFNGSLCLKMQFGLPLSRLGTPHLIRYHILMPHSTIRQERSTPTHAGSYHPAMRERGRAIPSSHIVPRIQDRPDHVSPIKMRPPMGGAGHVVPAPKGSGSLGLLMPLYTIGIIIFFLYTVSKVLFGIFMPVYTVGNVLSLLFKVLQVLRKNDDQIPRTQYVPSTAEREYQNLVFNPEIFAAAVTAVNGTPPERNEKSSQGNEEEEEEPAPSMEELKEHQALKSNGLAAEHSPNLKDSNGEIREQDDKELEEYHEANATVKVVNMEMTASCEGGQKRSRPTTPILATPQSHMEEKEKTPPISIYLEGALPPQCELLVTDSKTQELQEEESVEVPVVLSGKMTLSLISLDQESEENQKQVELETENRDTRSTEISLPTDCDNSEKESGNDESNMIKDFLNNEHLVQNKQTGEICEDHSEEYDDEDDDDGENQGSNEILSVEKIANNSDYLKQNNVKLKNEELNEYYESEDEDDQEEEEEEEEEEEVEEEEEEEEKEEEDEDSDEALQKSTPKQLSNELESYMTNIRGDADESVDDEEDEDKEENDEEYEEEEEGNDVEEEEEDAEGEEIESKKPDKNKIEENVDIIKEYEVEEYDEDDYEEEDNEEEEEESDDDKEEEEEDDDEEEAATQTTIKMKETIVTKKKN